MITADQLLCHAIGDYLLQSDWMATRKTERLWVAIVHALSYSLPFLALRPTAAQWLMIWTTHAVIDRWRLARYVVWAKNFLAPKHIRDEVDVLSFNRRQHVIMRRNHPWAECSATGYHKDRPAWLAVWLLIIGDNVLHVVLNGIAFAYVPW
jgi:Protein of unknown function (DUF3307)